MLKIITIALALVAGSTTGFDKPESAYWHEGAWYVSNVAGSPVGKDGSGWISKMDADGRIVAEKWVEGLNAPKGMRAGGGKLYVADIDQLRIIDIETGKLEQSVPYEGAQFLNDVAIDADGTVYISDMFTSKVHTWKDGKAGTFVEGEALEHPNGMIVEGGKLIIAAWGPGLDPATFATTKPGRLLSVDLKSKKIAPLGSGARVGNLDGLEKWGESYLATDYMSGKLYRIEANGSSKLMRDGFTNGADIGFDAENSVLAIPEMGADKVTFMNLSE